MRIAASIAVFVGLAAVGGSAAASDPWKALYRPLTVPKLAPGAACPVSTVDPSVDFARFGHHRGIGPGPAYPVSRFFADHGMLPLASPAYYESRRWGGQKVLWFVRPGYWGRVLIRGRQLDGRHLVRFERGQVPPSELRIERGRKRTPRSHPSTTRLRAPGCYGYQIDGASFSRVIVFRADWES